ncbi:hypothetical protein KIH74_24875 [Kineosporia sp. J2-2]|uniref:VCBS repeat-containing protein n=1 Tax=Kineosporia corallincola TaxID=2835133 RepID=A0ABS5TM66_9ACTN|nr:hypothetical protein [Kineosporia corallincola]MBT0772202.1 hypothetical protein [Kineosporia corallincola]
MLGTLVALAALALPPQTSSVCTGVPGCDVVKRIDVDGDGNRDQIGVRQKNRHSVEFRVRTSKRLLVKRLRVESWDDDAYFGAARIDGVRGAEIVYANQLGADLIAFKVLTFRDGALVVQKPPTTRAPGNPFAGQWVVAGSYGVFEGIRRTVRDHRAFITLYQGNRDHFGAQSWSGRATTFVWRKKQADWRRHSVRRVTAGSDKKVRSAYYGWHVKGLPQL